MGRPPTFQPASVTFPHSWASAKVLTFRPQDPWKSVSTSSTTNGVQLGVVDLLVLAHVDPHSCPRVVLGVVPANAQPMVPSSSHDPSVQIAVPATRWPSC